MVISVIFVLALTLCCLKHRQKLIKLLFCSVKKKPRVHKSRQPLPVEYVKAQHEDVEMTKAEEQLLTQPTVDIVRNKFEILDRK